MLINNIFVEYLDIFIIIYLNNIIIYLKNLNKYQKDIKIVFDKLLTRELKYKLEKYEFHKSEINFLRFLVSVNRIKIDPKKARIINS